MRLSNMLMMFCSGFCIGATLGDNESYPTCIAMGGVAVLLLIKEAMFGSDKC